MRAKRAFYSIIANLILQFIIIIYGFIVPKVIIDNFGSEVNGLVTSITHLLGYIAMLESGFGPVVLAALYKPIEKRDIKKITNILMASLRFFRKISTIFVLYIIFLMILYPIIVAKDFSIIFTVSLVVIMAISTFSEYFFGMTYRLLIQADQKQYVISIIQILTYVLSVVAILVLAAFGSSVHMIELVSGIIFAIKPLLQNIYVKHHYRIELKTADKNYRIKKKWDGLAQHIAFTVHSNTDIAVLTFMSSMSEVSVYSVYYLVVCGVRKFITSFASGLEATFGNMMARNEFGNLKRKFNIYETLFGLISTISFASAMVLITPFISVYTEGITDADYIRNTFGVLLVISEFIWAIRQPYNLLVKAAGRFRQTRMGAWVEAVVNIVVSIVLVSKFGIVGVAIGTIVAMFVRAIDLIHYTNKYILKCNNQRTVLKIGLIIVETVLIVLVMNHIGLSAPTGYLSWFLNAIVTVLISTAITVPLNLIFFRDDFRFILLKIKGRRKKR